MAPQQQDPSPSRESMKATISDTASESASFVSAESINTSAKANSQSGDPPHSSSSTPQSHDASDTSSTSSNLQQQTPLATRNTANLPHARSPYQESTHAGYFALQPGTPGSESRSPFTSKRPPASRSSHGIETKSGPPPALSTQRSYNADSPWRRLSPPEPLSPGLSQPNVTGRIDSVLNSNQQAFQTNAKQNRSDKGRYRRSLDAMTSSRADFGEDEQDQDSTIRVNGRHGPANGLQLRQERHQEDLFLNLARSSPLTHGKLELGSALEGKRSRGNDTSRFSRPSSSGRPTSSGGRFFNQAASTMVDPHSLKRNTLDSGAPTVSLASLRAEMNHDRPYAASAHPLDQRHRMKGSGANPKTSFSISRHDDDTRSAVYGRRRSIHATHGRFHPSNLGENNRTPGLEDDTESTVSTTAPSTVWDELDDLKARIRKIENTGNIPTNPTSTISNNYRERPATASTTLTTASMSPKRRHRASASPEASTIPENPTTDSHPLLRSALARAKALVSPALYRSLEATSSDAFALAALAGGRSTYSSGAAAAPTAQVDRQLRRKADNMCRSLTELCIALAEDKEPSGASQAISLVTSPTATPQASQEAKNDPDLAASSRVLSRLEARRSSLRNGSNSNQQSLASSPQSEMPILSRETDSYANSLDRSTSLVRRREDPSADKASQKLLTRAATDAGSQRSSAHARSSREYTSKHPLPSPPGTLSVQRSSALPEKVYFPSNRSTTSSVVGSARPSVERSVPAIADTSRLAEARQRRLASLGHFGSSPTAHASSRRLQPVGSEDA